MRGPYELRPGPCDTGIVQSSSVAHDDEATCARRWRSTRRSTIASSAEAAALAHDEVALVVGDIPPLAFEVAERLRRAGHRDRQLHVGLDLRGAAACSCAMPRRAHPAPAPGLREGDARARTAVRRRVRRLSPRAADSARRAAADARSRDDTRAHFGLPLDRPVALLSFGGYGLARWTSAALDCLDTGRSSTTDRIGAGRRAPPTRRRAHPKSRFAGPGFATKISSPRSTSSSPSPGYGIIAECIATGTAMLYTSRGEFREYDLLVSADARATCGAASSARTTCSPDAGATRCEVTAAPRRRCGWPRTARTSRAVYDARALRRSR